MAGLNRILLIDTHLPGVVELKLDGHTNICGTNASGKTTLQRLIPVFYGEYPSRVVPATRDSFERWYLPRPSSFIIYEYLTHAGELAQMVLSSNGTGVNYRLIAKAFELDDYLYQSKEGKHSSLGINDVTRALKRANIVVSNQLNTKEFRAVIQNDKGVINASTSNRELLGYARLFSLSEDQQNLRHIEKLAKAVHSKEGKMETIKAMIAAVLEEDGVQPPVSSLSATRVEDWIRECHLIRDFDAIRPDFAKLQQAEHELAGTEQRLGELVGEFALDGEKLSAEIIRRQDGFEQAMADLKTLEAQFGQTRDELNQLLSSARADAKKFEADLERVEQEFDNWQEQDIETLQANLQALPAWTSELDTLTTRYQLLTEKHQDIEATYNKRLVAISEKLADELEGLSEEKARLQDKIAEQKAEQQSQHQAIERQYNEQRTEEKARFDTQLGELKVQHASLSSDLKNTGFNAFEQGQLDLLDAAVKEASMLEDAARDDLTNASKAYDQAIKQRDSALATLEEQRRACEAARNAVAEVEKLLYPGEGTLLEYLRRHAKGWEATIGKVVSKDLLSRTDLAPKAGSGESLFGVELALGALEAPAYSGSEQELQGQLVAAQDVLAKANDAQNQAEQQLASASEQLRSMELARARAESAVRTAEANRKRASQDKEQLQQEYQQAVSERKATAKARLEENLKQQKKSAAQYELAMAEINDQQREAQTEQQFHWQQLIGDAQQQLEQVLEHMQKAKSLAQQDKRQTQEWLNNELNQRGVDIDEIGSLQKRIKALNEDIQHTQNNRNKVKDFERWYQTIFTGHKVTWQQGLMEARKQIAKSERELKAQEAAFNELRQQHKDSKSEHESALRLAKEQQQEVLSLSRQLAKLKLTPVESVPTTTLGQRLSEGQSLLQERERLLDDIRAYVDHFDGLIASQAGTGLSDTWEKAREECSRVNDQGVKQIEHRKMVRHLDRLLNDIVPQKLQGLREQGRIFGADLTAYYRVLADIDKRILSQSARITDEVEQELYLDGVSDSSVIIRSRISELEFWPELKHFHKQHQAWMDSGALELPGNEYASSMRKVIDILGRSALGGGISRLLDIELHLTEGSSKLVIRTDRQLNESSSHGMAYLILCKFLLAFTRLLRGDAKATIHWPIDELGTLHQSNIKKIFDACHNNAISVVGAFPNPESEVLSLFDNRYLIDKASRRLQVVQPKVSAISELIKQKQQENVA